MMLPTNPIFNSNLGLRPPRWVVFARGAIQTITAGAMVYLVLSYLPACQHQPGGYLTTAALSGIQTQPLVRVRVARGVDAVRLDGRRRLLLRTPPQRKPEESHELDLMAPLHITRRTGAWVIQRAHGQPMTWATPVVIIECLSGPTVRVDGVAYPHQIVLHADPDPPGDSAGRFDVVNHLPIEQYLPGVLHRELYSSWPHAAFQAQAIAARSYAIANCGANWRRHFDLESTTASQAYAGATANARARQAVRQTHGVVLTYRGRVLPAYYASSCGGLGQDAAIAFPNQPDTPPLVALNHGDWCAQSPSYRWGPLTRSCHDLARRFAAWGRRHKHAIAKIQAITSIRISATNAVGRPSRFGVTDAAGHTFHLSPEQFRFACNHRATGLPPLPKPLRLKSSYLSVRVQGDVVRFTGRGHGHGVGLCQWGTHGMAKRGHNAQAILAFYYPGVQIERAY